MRQIKVQCKQQTDSALSQSICYVIDAILNQGQLNLMSSQAITIHTEKRKHPEEGEEDLDDNEADGNT